MRVEIKTAKVNWKKSALKLVSSSDVNIQKIFRTLMK